MSIFILIHPRSLIRVDASPCPITAPSDTDLACDTEVPCAGWLIKNLVVPPTTLERKGQQNCPQRGGLFMEKGPGQRSLVITEQ